MSENIASLVQKLLRLAKCQGATPAEAANALARALELIDKHNIDIASLDLDQEAERLICDRIHIGQRMSLIKRLVSGVVRAYFNVRTCIDYPHLAILGFEQDVAIAGYVFDYLVRAATDAVKTYAAEEKSARRKVTSRKKNSFIQGWIYGVSSNLGEKREAAILEDSKLAIVLSTRKERVAAYFSEVFPRSVVVKHRQQSRNKKAIWRGFCKGQGVTIHQPLTGSTSAVLKLGNG